MPTIPFIHPKVSIDDIHSNGKLLTDEQVKIVERGFAATIGKNRLTKSTLNVGYPVIEVNNQIYAVYKGEKQGKELGAGSFGKAKLVQNVRTGEWAVLKIIKFDADSKEKRKRSALHEKRNLAKYHPEKNVKYYVREDKGQIEILMPIAMGATIDKVAVRREMPPLNWLKMIKSMAEGIKSLHDVGLYHRDIKPENMLYDPVNDIATPIDLGLAIDVDDANDRPAAGSPAFMAPEIREKYDANENYNHTIAAEVYSLGASMADALGMQLVKNIDLFIHLNTPDTFKEKISDTKIRKELTTLIYKMVDDNPSERPSMEAVINQLDAIQKKYYQSHLNVMSQLNKLAYVDVDKVVRLMQSDNMYEVVTALQQADVVQLVSADNDVDKVRRVKHALVAEGIQVMDETFTLKDQNNKAQELADNAKSLEKQNDKMYTTFYVRNEGEKSIHSEEKNTHNVCEIIVDGEKSYKEQMALSLKLLGVDKTHLNRVYTNLTDQMMRMDVSDKRRVMIQDYATKLTATPPGNYQELLKGLEKLEREMMGKGKGFFSRLVESKLGFRATTTTKLVHESAHRIEKEVGPPPKKKL